ncbi:hypothetical protein EDC64_11258 [Aquabacter spiritensis]|uniref:Uncharacterized protein n=1 Tax=Aquabacter spiritensis TaxID=933073 RepID=A0A4R3LVC4_9HYPH|nr:hypothetical protein EDC64_11258 [Aquabacter spiritensis]
MVSGSANRTGERLSASQARRRLGWVGLARVRPAT